MNTFSLTIVTPDGLRYEGQAEELIVRAVSGDMGILAGHIDITTALGSGEARVVMERTYALVTCTYLHAIFFSEFSAACQSFDAVEDRNRIVQSSERVDAYIESVVRKHLADIVREAASEHHDLVVV